MVIIEEHLAMQYILIAFCFIGNKDIIANIYRIQAYDSIMCGYFCIGFIDFKEHSPVIDNIWGADLVGMQLISKFNKGFRFLSCVIDTFNKYSWVIPLKDKKDITTTSTFQKNLDESNRKPNKIWVDKGS